MMTVRRGKSVAAILAGAWLVWGAPCRGQTALTARQLIENLKTKTYSGERIDLKFEAASLPEMISKFAEISGFDFHISPEVLSRPQPRMQYAFMGSPWDSALASVLNGYGLDLRPEGDELWVDVFKPEKDKTVSAFLIGSITAVILLGGGLLFLSRRKRRRRNLEREKKIALEPEAVEEIVQRVKYLFQVEKIHRNGRLTLDSFAERLGIQPYQLSGIVNRRLGKSFTDLVADYRVEEAKKRLSDLKETANILNIAFDAGFGTKASFNRIFKERTGQTPSEFKRKSTASS